MAKIKYTKNELKAQRDALTRFRRYLPTLLLKKQQLQLELRMLEGQIAAKRNEEERARADLAAWVKLFSEPFVHHVNITAPHGSERSEDVFIVQLGDGEFLFFKWYFVF